VEGLPRFALLEPIGLGLPRFALLEPIGLGLPRFALLEPIGLGLPRFALLEPIGLRLPAFALLEPAPPEPSRTGPGISDTGKTVRNVRNANGERRTGPAGLQN
jgi:hypothetical protein